MKVLIVEDDLYKLKRLKAFVAAEAPDSEVRDARAYQVGLRAVLDWKPDLVLLDISMPTFAIGGVEKGGRPRSLAGREILAEMRRKKSRARAIVVTQFESFGEGPAMKTLSQLKRELAHDFPDCYIGAVYYSAAESGWEKALKKLFAKAMATK